MKTEDEYEALLIKLSGQDATEIETKAGDAIASLLRRNRRLAAVARSMQALATGPSTDFDCTCQFVAREALDALRPGDLGA